MQSSRPGSTLKIIILLGLCIAITGCIGGERFAVTDIQIGKYDSNGQPVWNTVIDSGKQDYATAVIRTPDNGYAVAGWIAEEPRAPPYPRVIRLDSSGKVQWDRTLDPDPDEAVALASLGDGGFIVAQKSGKIAKLDTSGIPVWNRTWNYTPRAVIPARDGGFVLAGGHTAGFDGDGALQWDLPYSSKSLVPADDGGFFAEYSGVPTTYGSVFRIDRNGMAWNQLVGSHEMGEITSLAETPEGTVEVVYTYNDRTRNKEVVMFMESEQVTLGTGGNASERRTLVAVNPLIRTGDGGYAFVAYPFPDPGAFTTVPYGKPLHLVRLSPAGVPVFDKPLDVPPWAAPQAVLQTPDGGFVTLIVTGS